MKHEQHEWNVYVDDAMIGTMSGADFSALKRVAFNDSRVAVAQALNLVSVVQRILMVLIIMTPLLAFCCFFILSIFAPMSILETMQMLQSPDTTIGLAALSKIVHTIGILICGCICGLLLTGYRFGFRNHYKAAVTKALKRRFKVPADCDITLNRW